MKNSRIIEEAYQHAKEEYAAIEVDADAAIREMDKVKISLHCWQADDVGDFEGSDAELGGGGIMVTGNKPGKADRTAVCALRNNTRRKFWEPRME